MPVPRQLLLIAKIVPGVDAALDAEIENLDTALCLRRFVNPALTGRGLLHWASWYDPWLMEADLCPGSWSIDIHGIEVADGVWQLDLSSDWSKVRQAVDTHPQWQEQSWLLWHLLEAHNAFQQQNPRAVMYYGRYVVGQVLSDSELLSAPE